MERQSHGTRFHASEDELQAYPAPSRGLAGGLQYHSQSRPGIDGLSFAQSRHVSGEELWGSAARLPPDGQRPKKYEDIK